MFNFSTILQCCWDKDMYEFLHPIKYCECKYLSLPQSQLHHVNERGHWMLMKLAGRHHDAIKWGSYLPHWTQYHLPHLITQQSAVPCYYTPNIRPRIAYKRHFMTVSDPCSILALLWNSLELKGFILGWRTWGMKFYAQSGAVIMRSNKTWYHVQHCSDWRRIYLWVNSLTPGWFKINFTWVILKLILVVNGWGISPHMNVTGPYVW